MVSKLRYGYSFGHEITTRDIKHDIEYGLVIFATKRECGTYPDFPERWLDKISEARCARKKLEYMLIGD